MKDVIATQRKELGYTQQQLAEKLNISDKVVSKWETGRCLPDTSILTDLAEVLGISVNALLKSDTVSKTTVKEAFITETRTKYKNTFIITMAIQLIAVILMTVGRITSRTAQYDYNKARILFFVLTLFSVLIEIGAITFYLVTRNNLLNKYPTSVVLDKQYINHLLWCTYPFVLTVMLVFVICHGLEFYEQIITALVFCALFVIPFILGHLWNKKRKI